MRQGTPRAGLDLIARRVYIEGPALTLLAYTNTPDSLSALTVLAELLQPDPENGYGPLLLTPSGFATADGIVTYTHPAGPNTDAFGRPCWFATGAWSAAVTGAAIAFGSTVLHFWDLRDANGDPMTFYASAGRQLAIDPAMILSA